jgi:hypothetical protein
MVGCNRNLPFLVYIAIHQCDKIGDGWYLGAEQRRLALLVMPDEHPTFREFINANRNRLGLANTAESAWNHPDALKLDKALVDLETPIWPVFAERTLVLALH